MKIMTRMMKDVITKTKDIIIVMEDMKEKSPMTNMLRKSPEMRRRYRRNSCRRIGAVRRKIGIYIHIIFSTLFSHVMSPATLLSYLQNNIRVWISLPAIIISHMGFGVYM